MISVYLSRGNCTAGHFPNVGRCFMFFFLLASCFIIVRREKIWKNSTTMVLWEPKNGYYYDRMRVRIFVGPLPAFVPFLFSAHNIFVSTIAKRAFLFPFYHSNACDLSWWECLFWYQPKMGAVWARKFFVDCWIYMQFVWSVIVSKYMIYRALMLGKFFWLSVILFVVKWL